MLISRDDILKVTEREDKKSLFRLLARLTHQGFHLLLTAPQPEQWPAAQGVPDDALLGPDSIRRLLNDAGGALDGVYYVPKSSLTQRRNREQALQDIIDRYAVSSERCYLYSSSGKFVEAANRLGLNSSFLDQDSSLADELSLLI